MKKLRYHGTLVYIGIWVVILYFSNALITIIKSYQAKGQKPPTPPTTQGDK